MKKTISMALLVCVWFSVLSIVLSRENNHWVILKKVDSIY